MIRQLQEADAQAYVELRQEALLESPLAFTSSPGDDIATTVDAFREQLERSQDSVIIGAFDEHLVGAVGLYREPHIKASHKVHLWGMYVTPSHRRRGLGAELLDAAIRHARSLPGIAWVHLCVSSAAPEAQKLYEQARFRTWGTEPDSLRHAGEVIDEHHMALRLEEPAS
jgi:RimJ/RimL family protein N-acetyltransferase